MGDDGDDEGGDHRDGIDDEVRGRVRLAGEHVDVCRADTQQQDRAQPGHHPGQVEGDIAAQGEHSKHPAVVPALRPCPDENAHRGCVPATWGANRRSTISVRCIGLRPVYVY